MVDYIRKDIARRIIDGWRNREQMLAMLEDTPSADVQPVIRCKDCKWCVDADGLMCKNVKSWVVATEPSFGCVYGERKDDEQNGSID